MLHYFMNNVPSLGFCYLHMYCLVLLLVDCPCGFETLLFKAFSARHFWSHPHRLTSEFVLRQNKRENMVWVSTSTLHLLHVLIIIVIIIFHLPQQTLKKDHGDKIICNEEEGTVVKIVKIFNRYQLLVFVNPVYSPTYSFSYAYALTHPGAHTRARTCTYTHRLTL